jgi:hypothetical protein
VLADAASSPNLSAVTFLMLKMPVPRLLYKPYMIYVYLQGALEKWPNRFPVEASEKKQHLVLI